jgi:hypothetical protein
MIKLLEGKVKNLSVKDKQCSLLMDEVALKKGLRYCKINTKKLSSLQRKLMTKNDTSKTANMKWDGSV